LGDTHHVNLLTTAMSLEQNFGVATASNPLAGEWGSRPLRRGDARRISRSFAEVGVEIPTTRLRQLAAGAAFASDELDDIKFALIATELQREERHAKYERGRRRAVRWIVVACLVLVALNSLVCLAYSIFYVLQPSPLH